MKNILDFCFSKISYIQDKLDMYSLHSRSKIDFFIPYDIDSVNNDKLMFKYIGSGTYGNILRVHNLTEETSIVPNKGYFIMKIMKVKHDEPERCLKIKKVIKKIKTKRKDVALNKIKLDLISKYTTQILDVKKGKKNEVIFLEYVKGIDLKDFMSEEELTTSDIDLIYLQCLISVRIFHKILRFSHRDLKLENMFFHTESKKVKVLDYSFICNREDRDCYERNQGTAKYIHLKQNKITTQKYITNRNNINSPISVRNTRTRKKNYNFPESFSQDLFSLIIILFKLYYHYNSKYVSSSLEESRVYHILKDYNEGFRKYHNKYKDKKHRYKLKNRLFKDLLKLPEDEIQYDSINIVVNIIRKYWNFEKRDFMYDGKTGDIVATKIIEELIDSLINVTKLSKEKSSKTGHLVSELSNKKEILEDIGKLKLINS